jgi:hypothetical protein
MPDFELSIWDLVVRWLFASGLRITLILVLSLVVYQLAKRAIPRMMAAAIS